MSEATLTLSERARAACRRLNLPEAGPAFSVIRSALREAAKDQRHLAADTVSAQRGDASTLCLIHQAVMNARLPDGG
jgi:hypothetical protein